MINYVRMYVKTQIMEQILIFQELPLIFNFKLTINPHKLHKNIHKQKTATTNDFQFYAECVQKFFRYSTLIRHHHKIETITISFCRQKSLNISVFRLKTIYHCIK